MNKGTSAAQGMKEAAQAHPIPSLTFVFPQVHCLCTATCGAGGGGTDRSDRPRRGRELLCLRLGESLNFCKPLFPFSMLGIVITLMERLLGLVSTQCDSKVGRGLQREDGVVGRSWRNGSGGVDCSG